MLVIIAAPAVALYAWVIQEFCQQQYGIPESRLRTKRIIGPMTKEPTGAHYPVPSYAFRAHLHKGHIQNRRGVPGSRGPVGVYKRKSRGAATRMGSSSHGVSAR